MNTLPMLARIASSATVIAALLVGLILLGSGARKPISGAMQITSGEVCIDITPGEPCSGALAQLPVSGAIGGTFRMRFVLPEISNSILPKALYFPSFADGLDVFVDGAMVLRTAPPEGPFWHWNRPAHVRVPADLLADGGHRLEVIVRGATLFEAALSPFHFGPDAVLFDAYRLRLMATSDVAWLGLLLAGFCTVGLGALAVVRRRDRVYHWAALAGASATVLSLHYGAFRPPLPEALWQSIWTVSVPLLVASLHSFIRRLLRRPRDRAETLTIAFALGTIPVMFLVPERFLLTASAVLHATFMVITLYLIAILIRDRKFISQDQFLTLYLAMCLTTALALHDAAYLYIHPSPVAMQLGQFMPMIFMFVTGWLVVVQLSTSLRRQETLAARLRSRVIARSSALRATSDLLLTSERKALLAAERQRILMDLHDGVGGHLINALSWLRRAPAPDPLLRSVLEEAQTDLGLMVDSLDNPGDVVTLLAALRSRLDPVLERQGISFDWQIVEEPRLPTPGPTANINLLRIVQEFVSNTVKHADARCIVVRTGAAHLSLSDDGVGYDLSGPQADGHRGQGIASMHRRAAAIGARVDMQSGPSGTRMRLDWSGDQNAQS
jgi:signal transduction histidine kinase